MFWTFNVLDAISSVLSKKFIRLFSFSSSTNRRARSFRILRIESFEARLAFAMVTDAAVPANFVTETVNAAPFQNPANKFDCNNDGLVSPIDVLNVINALKQNGERNLSAPMAASSMPTIYSDVNGDGLLSPLDVLVVINALSKILRQPSDVSIKPDGDGLAKDTPGIGTGIGNNSSGSTIEWELLGTGVHNSTTPASSSSSVINLNFTDVGPNIALTYAPIEEQRWIVLSSSLTESLGVFSFPVHH